ncbi:hypothetical protein IST4119_05195 [Burkholderia multivorans]|nr:hypothetical protein IST4119_05195 [Burkholderia multivorans]
MFHDCPCGALFRLALLLPLLPVGRRRHLREVWRGDATLSDPLDEPGAAFYVERLEHALPKHIVRVDFGHIVEGRKRATDQPHVVAGLQVFAGPHSHGAGLEQHVVTIGVGQDLAAVTDPVVHRQVALRVLVRRFAGGHRLDILRASVGVGLHQPQPERANRAIHVIGQVDGFLIRRARQTPLPASEVVGDKVHFGGVDPKEIGYTIIAAIEVEREDIGVGQD